MQDIEAMGKKATFGNNITLTPDECDTLKHYAVNGIIAVSYTHLDVYKRQVLWYSQAIDRTIL